MNDDYVVDLVYRLKNLRNDINRFPEFLRNTAPETIGDLLDISKKGFPDILYHKFENITIQDTLDGAIKVIKMKLLNKDIDQSLIDNVVRAINYVDECLGQYGEQYLYEGEVLGRSRDYIES